MQLTKIATGLYQLHGIKYYATICRPGPHGKWFVDIKSGVATVADSPCTYKTLGAARADAEALLAWYHNYAAARGE